MAFNVIIQNNTSEKKRVNKVITDIETVSGVLKEDCSIVDPVILVRADLADFISANYMTIPAFGRSYFLNPPKSVNGGFVEFSGHCDVLSSFKTETLANNAIISRSEANWNLYLNDGSLKTYQNPIITTKKFPTGFYTHSYILVLGG